MKQQCIVDREKLLNAVSLATRVVNTKNQIREILRCVMVTTSDSGDGIDITGTNLEEWMRIHVDNEVASPMRVLVPLEDLMAALRNISSDTVAIKAVDHTFSIEGQTGWVVSMQCPDPDEFPIVEFDTSPVFTIRGQAFSRLIDQVAYAVADTYMLTESALFEIEDDGPRLVAVGTDGRRLATTSAPATLHKQEHPSSFRLLSKMCQTIKTVLKDYDADLPVTVTETQLTFTAGNVQYRCLLGEARTLKWRPVATLPDEHNKVITVNAEELQRAMRFAMSVDNRNHVAEFRIDNAKVKVTAVRTFLMAAF